jgi:hypothetical protein
MATIKREDLWGGIQSIGCEDGTADKLSRAVIAKLIKLKFVELSASGLPMLTAKGSKAYTVMESGGGEVAELDGYGR